MGTPYVGYVIADTGAVYVQLPADNQWGFVLASDDQAFSPAPAGVRSWRAVPADDPEISLEDRERLEWLLSEYR